MYFGLCLRRRLVPNSKPLAACQAPSTTFGLLTTGFGGLDDTITGIKQLQAIIPPHVTHHYITTTASASRMSIRAQPRLAHLTASCRVLNLSWTPFSKTAKVSLRFSASFRFASFCPVLLCRMVLFLSFGSVAGILGHIFPRPRCLSEHQFRSPFGVHKLQSLALPSPRSCLYTSSRRPAGLWAFCGAQGHHPRAPAPRLTHPRLAPSL